MKRVHAFISGEVQGVGYREAVKRIAFDLNIFGWIMNLEDGKVESIAEGESKNIEDFLDKINIRRYPIFVEEIKVDEETYTGEFRSFKVIRDKDIQKELLSSLSRGTVEIHEVKEILLDVRHDTSAMLQKQDETIHILQSVKEDTSDIKSTLSRMECKQDKMLEKQETTIQILQSVKDDTGEMKSSLARIEVDVKETKFSLSSFIEEKFRKQEVEIAEIKATLARILEEG